MSALGAIGVAETVVRVLPLDTAMAQNIAETPCCGRHEALGVALPYGQNWGVLSGTASSGGAHVERTVIALRRSDLPIAQGTVSNADSGAFSFSVPFAGEDYVVIALGAAGENSAVFDWVVPVS